MYVVVVRSSPYESISAASQFELYFISIPRQFIEILQYVGAIRSHIRFSNRIKFNSSTLKNGIKMGLFQT